MNLRYKSNFCCLFPNLTELFSRFTLFVFSGLGFRFFHCSNRKEKSLGLLKQNFVKLFLFINVSERLLGIASSQKVLCNVH